MIKDLAGQGGIVLFLAKNSSLYAIEGSNNLANHLTVLFQKEYLSYLVSLKPAKNKVQIKSLYQELLKAGWKNYDLYLLENWKTSENIDIKQRLVAYHTKYQPKLNLFRYVSLANGEIETVYQWNQFKTEEQMLAKSQKKAASKPLLNYRINDKSP